MCWPGGYGGGFGGARNIPLMGWLLTFLAAASLAVGIANTVYTYINYNNLVNNGCPNGSIINMCVVLFTYISPGIWASIPIFFTGILAVRMSVVPNLTGLFRILVIVDMIIFAPAMIIISAIEATAWNGTCYSVTSTTITGDVTKFALPVTVAALGAVEFIILLLLTCIVLRGGANLFTVGAPIVGGGALYGGGFPYGGAVPYGGGYLGGDVGLGGDDLGVVDDGGMFDYGPPPFGSPGPQFIPFGGGGPGGGAGGAGGPGGSGGGAAGGGAAGGSAAASSGGGNSGGGGASNNNNNNIVVPPIIIPPAPAAPSMPFMPFPMFMPSNNAPAPAPIIITTTTAAAPAPAPAPLPPPQPVFLPLPSRRPMPLPPPPIPPSRYYPRY